MSRATASALKIKVQIFCGEEIAMGPGKAIFSRPSPERDRFRRRAGRWA